MPEEYWSLQKLTDEVFYNLKNNYEVLAISLSSNNQENQTNIDNLYKECDVVIYIASKLAGFKRLSDKPTIFFAHAWMDHGAGINLYINQGSFRRDDILLFASSSARNKFNQVYTTNIKTVVFPYFTDIPEILLTKQEKELRVQYGLSNNSKILIYFGRLSPEKNIEGLFDLAKKNQDKDFIILVVGDFSSISTFGFGENYMADYKDEIKKAILTNTSGKIKFIDRLSEDDLAELISISYLTINLSLCLEEDFGLSIVESMAMGVPAIASNWGGFKDIITSKQDGFLVRTFFLEDKRLAIDINEAAIYIKNLLSNEKKRNELAIKAKNKAQQLFSSKSFIINLNSLLTKINDGSIVKDKLFFYPKDKYLAVYQSALEHKSVKTIYLDNLWLFQDLYKYYL